MKVQVTQHPLLPILLIIVILKDTWWYLTIVLISISLMINVVYILNAICILLLIKSPNLLFIFLVYYLSSHY